MAITNGAQMEKNIWIAAGDGDLERVRYLVEHQGVSPNAPDPFTYTPMHAAASYGHLDVLSYLIQRGGDVDVTDEDGDTPLYTVENVETARFLVEHGATVNRMNVEGVSPQRHLFEEFPEVAAYLQTLASVTPNPGASPGHAPPSQYAENVASEQLTFTLMERTREILQRAEAEGRDPEEELRQAVGRTVLEGIVTGYGMGVQADEGGNRNADLDPSTAEAKRARTDEGPK